MSYIDHAMREFKAAGYITADGSYSDDMQELMCEQVLELLKLFSEHGHSGSSAPYAINLFKMLASFEPLVPIQGTDDEWIDRGDDFFQNTRCSHIFRNPNRFNGQAYDSEAIIFYNEFIDEDGEVRKSHYMSSNSAQPITFPYMPKREYRKMTSYTDLKS